MRERAYGWLILLASALLLPASSGCSRAPDVEGTWTGASSIAGGVGLHYTLNLVEEAEGIRGTGGVALHNRADAAPDRTYALEVEGTYAPPRLTLVITGPDAPRGLGRQATFRGEMQRDGNVIAGDLSLRSGEVVALVLRRR